jgi:hypothetical protein
MANGKWTIQHDHSLKTFSFDTREEAADYAREQLRNGSYDLILTTPDGRTGFIGTPNEDGSLVYGSAWQDDVYSS